MREIRGKVHEQVVLRITEWDDRGRPSKAIIGYDDTVFDLSDENQSREFMTAYIPADMSKPRTRNN